MSNNIFLLAPHNNNNLAAGTYYSAVGTASGLVNTTEAQIQTTWRDAGTFSNMACYVEMNVGSSTTVATFRIGASSGNQTVSFVAGASGVQTDTTHTDVVSAGNQLDYQSIIGTGGGSYIYAFGIQFSATTSSNIINKLGCNGALTDTSVSTSYYNPLSGTLSKSTTEANAQFKSKTAATLQNLYVYVSNNTATVATVDSRIGGSNGNLTVSITSGTIGALEDTSHTDSISSGNLINTAINATLITTLSITNISVDFLTTTSSTHYFCGISTGETIATSLNTCNWIGGDPVISTTETSRNIPLPGLPFTASNLESYIITNTITANTTLFFRINTSNGNQNVLYGSGITGYMEDTSNSDVINSSAKVNYRWSSGATGTSIIFGTVGVLANYSLSPAIGSASGLSTVLGIGAPKFFAFGFTSGAGIATATISANFNGVGSASGTCSVTSIGSTSGYVASSTGTATVLAIGLSNFLSVGSASGSSTVVSLSGSIGLAMGTSSVASVSASKSIGVGSATGASSATAFDQSFGIIIGSSTVSGIGESMNISIGSSVGSTIASGIGASSFSSVGLSSGISIITAFGDGFYYSSGYSMGSAMVNAYLLQSSYGIGIATGNSNVSGNGNIVPITPQLSPIEDHLNILLPPIEYPNFA